MTFTHLPKIASFIRKHHILFAGYPVEQALSVLGRLNASINSSAVIGATFTAYQNIEGCGLLKSEIYIGRSDKGYWIYEEKAAN